MDKRKPATIVPAPSQMKPPEAPARGQVEPETPGQLTPEEQMELFAKDLKENDWGHQPC